MLARRDLSEKEQDVYDTLSVYLKRARVCTACSEYYSLQHSIGKFGTCNGARDHIDYESESPEFYNSLQIPYRIYLALQCESFLPTDEACIQIRRHPETHQPISANINRVKNPNPERTLNTAATPWNTA